MKAINGKKTQKESYYLVQNLGMIFLIAYSQGVKDSRKFGSNIKANHIPENLDDLRNPVLVQIAHRVKVIGMRNIDEGQMLGKQAETVQNGADNIQKAIYSFDNNEDQIDDESDENESSHKLTPQETEALILHKGAYENPYAPIGRKLKQFYSEFRKFMVLAEDVFENIDREKRSENEKRINFNFNENSGEYSDIINSGIQSSNKNNIPQGANSTDSDSNIESLIRLMEYGKLNPSIDTCVTMKALGSAVHDNTIMLAKTKGVDGDIRAIRFYQSSGNDLNKHPKFMDNNFDRK